MLEINNSLDKKELLYTLAKIANEPGTLFIKVQSLPTFLTTPIAFTIFNYQISNYPRNITWTSENFQILNFLKNCNVSVADPDTNFEKDRYNDIAESSSFLNWQEPEIKKVEPVNEIIEIETISNTPPVTRFSKPQNSITIGDKKPFTGGVDTVLAKQSIQARDLLQHSGYMPSSLINISNSNKADLQNSTQEDDDVFLHRGGDAFDFSMQTVLAAPKTNHNLSQIVKPLSEDLPNFNIYETQTTDKKEAQSYQPAKYDQNLDELLLRIEATRDALSSLKTPLKKTNSENGFVWKTLGFLSTSAIVSAVIVGFLFFFPTKVYSLDIVPETKTQNDTLTFNKDEFTNRKVSIESKDNLATTGQETKTENRATGRITLVNNSSGQIKFDKGGIILIANNGLEYRQIPQANEPSTFVVPGQSSSVTISIIAAANGTNYNLPINSILKIYNLKRDSLGSSFSGVVNSPVNVTKQTGNKIVSQDDINNLQSKAEKTVSKLAKEELTKLSQENVVTKEDWFEILSPSYNFTNKLGEISPSIAVNASASASLYYLDESVIVAKLKTINKNIQRVVEVTRVDSGENSIIQNASIDLKIDYKYALKQQFNEALIAQKLSNKNFDTAKDQLQSEYPTINDIEERKSGLDLPGINPRVEVKVNINDNDLK